MPQEHVRDGQIVLNVSPASCGKLLLGNEEITFDARFGGVPRNIVVPCKAVLAIYAKENGAGTVFTPEDDFEGDGSDLMPTPVQSSDTPDPKSAPSKGKKGKPNLTIVK